jgi:hypothetical protein
MRPILPITATVLMCFTQALAQTSAPKPAYAFDQQLIDRQKQFLNACLSKNTAAVDAAVADDFEGIQINGDFYDKGEIVESARTGIPANVRAYDFIVVKLNDGSAIVAYNLIVPGERPRYRHMTDTWARIDGQWKLKFRQITPKLWSENDVD